MKKEKTICNNGCDCTEATGCEMRQPIFTNKVYWPEVTGNDKLPTYIHPLDFIELDAYKQSLYSEQYQEWRSGWVDCSIKEHIVNGKYRKMHKLKIAIDAENATNQHINDRLLKIARENKISHLDNSLRALQLAYELGKKHFNK